MNSTALNGATEEAKKPETGNGRQRWPARVRRQSPPTPTISEMGGAVNSGAPAAGGSSRAERVADIALDALDSRKVRIDRVFATKGQIYAVYRAGGQMMVHFADDAEVADQQRCSLAPLAGMRAKLAVLTDELPEIEYYDQQIASAFQLALDGSPNEAKAVLTEAVATAERERACSGRIQYLTWAGLVSAFCLALLTAVYASVAADHPANNLLLAGMGGITGAVFSIALAIRTRTVALDLHRKANITDGILRVLIGVIAAGVVTLLLSTGAIAALEVGSAAMNGDTAGWELVLIAGFVAGFLERLLPNMLEPRTTATEAKPA